MELKPTDAELEILQILWERGPSTVREVNDLLSQNKDVGYTTTLKLMQIMHEKGFLSREASGRFHIYQAEISQEATRKNLLDRFIEAAFRGDATALVMQALGNHQTSDDELAQIKALIASIEEKNA